MATDNTGLKVSMAIIAGMLTVITTLAGILWSANSTAIAEAKQERKEAREAFSELAKNFAVMNSKVEAKIGDNALTLKLSESTSKQWKALTNATKYINENRQAINNANANANLPLVSVNTETD